jgi:hypothetical protein
MLLRPLSFHPLHRHLFFPDPLRLADIFINILFHVVYYEPFPLQGISSDAETAT